jgi:hypothetical protein
MTAELPALELFIVMFPYSWPQKPGLIRITVDGPISKGSLWCFFVQAKIVPD